jgi:hypothetical protein
MKKTVKIALGATLTLGVFSAGLLSKDIVTKASSDWASTAQNIAYSDLLGTANSTKNDLVSNIGADINNKINTAIQGTVDQQQADLERLMKEYYNIRLNGMTDTPEFKTLEQKIKDLQASVLTAFKTQIDQEFANQQQ